MDTTTTEPSISLRSPEDVLAATPYLMGFHPADSIVILGLTGRQLRFHARHDLPAAPTRRDEYAQIAAGIGELMADHGVTGAVLVGYGTEGQVRPMTTALREYFETVGITVQDMLRAENGRYWSYFCDRHECHRFDGTPYHVSGSAVATVAERAGLGAEPDRDALVRHFAGPEGDRLRAAVAAIDRALARVAALFAAGDGYAEAERLGVAAVADAIARCRRDEPLDEDELAWLCALLQFGRVRAYAWRLIDDDGGPERRTVHERLWTDVLNRCDPEFAGPVGTLLALVLWRGGDCMRAGLALDRALGADPESQGAQMLRLLVDRCEPPRAVGITDEPDPRDVWEP
jgi:hypothetical protein